MESRLKAAFDYAETLAVKYRAVDYIEDRVSLTEKQFNDLLNYFLDTKDYETSYSLCDKHSKLKKLKGAKTRL